MTTVNPTTIEKIPAIINQSHISCDQYHWTKSCH